MKLSELTELLLARLYDIGNEQPGAIVSADELCAEFGEKNPVNVMHAVQALQNRGYVTAMIALGPSSHAGISAEGRLFVEAGGQTGITFEGIRRIRPSSSLSRGIRPAISASAI